MRAHTRFAAAALVAGLAICAVDTADASGVGDWTRAEKADLRLVAATQAVGPGQEQLRLGLHVRLDPEWKIYWRSPGTAGLPPALAWSNSANLAETALRWPAPKRFELFGLQFGQLADGAGNVVQPCIDGIEVCLGRSLDHAGKGGDLALQPLDLPGFSYGAREHFDDFAQLGNLSGDIAVARERLEPVAHAGFEAPDPLA